MSKQIYNRYVEIEKAEDETQIISFSSETPYERFFGTEILDHSPSAVNLSRLNEIGCVLFNHDRNNVIGKIERAWIENFKGYAKIKFDSDTESQKIFEKVKSGTLKGISVGYTVDEWEEVKACEKSYDERFVGPCSIARKWTPLEISVVSVPADASVGVNRQETNGGEKMSEEINSEELILVERERINEITNLCREFEIDPSTYIKSGQTVDETRAEILKNLIKEKSPLNLSVIKDEGDKFREAAADSILIRSGLENIDKNNGAREFLNMSLRDLAIESLKRDNHQSLNNKSNDEILSILAREFYNPTSAFPSIMDQVINKSYVAGYKKVAVTFDKWTSKGTLRDFKTVENNYLIGNTGEFLFVPENGELKHDLPIDEKLPSRSLKTYGRQFTMSRQAFINDDIDFLTTIPARYAVSARKTINKQVYDILVNNPVIYDGDTIFSAKHKNLVVDGSKITSESLQEIIMQMQKQTDQFGDAIIINPAYLIVPVGYGFTVRTILGSPTINTNDNTQSVNPLYNYPIEVVEDPTINVLAKKNAVPWFIVGNKNDAKSIQVDYLNGQEIPTIRRMETAGQLGFVWDIYLDWGVTVIDYRGIAKNPGIKF